MVARERKASSQRQSFECFVCQHFQWGSKRNLEGIVDWLFQTDGSFSYVFLRFGLALTFFAHSSQQALGWHGGKGVKDQLANWNQKYHVPVAFGVFGLFCEIFGAISMTLGFLVRPAAFFLAGFIAMALFLGHWNNGFFLAQRHGRGSGIEYTLALLLMTLAVLVGGAGALSIDGLLSR
jgi:putative oxidoreductase